MQAIQTLDRTDIARTQLTRIKTHWEAFWVDLKEFHDSQRWLDLGYTNFKACAEIELGIGRVRVYQIIEAARIREELECSDVTTLQPLTVDQAHTLAPLPAPVRLEIARQVDFSMTSVRELRKIVQLAKSELDDRKAAQPSPLPKPVPTILPTDIELYCDDARSLSVYTSNVDLIVTSPPYGLEKDYHVGSDHPEDWGDFMFAWLTQAFAVTRDSGRLALNIPLDTTKGGFRPTYAETVAAAVTAGWVYRATIVWNEGTITHSTGRGSVDSPNSPHVIAPVEMIALFSKGPWERGRPSEPSDLTHTEWLEWTNGLWTFPGESRGWEGHAAPFPEELPRRLIKLLSFPGDLVCDPFLGSGTSALVAARLGRKFVGIDQSDIYIASTRRRLVGI